MDVVAQPAPTRCRTKRRGRHPDKALSAAFIRSAPPGRHADGNGLYLFVQPSGTRSWVQRLVIRGRRLELGLGAATLVPLARAREQALANRMLARSGGDPLSEKRRVQGVPTFAEAAQRVLEQKRGGWRGRWHAAQLVAEHGAVRLPAHRQSGPSPRSTPPTYWRSSRRSGTSRRRRPGRSASASAPCWSGPSPWTCAATIPATGWVPVLGPQNDIVTHRQALPHQDVAAVIETVRDGSAATQFAVRLAFEFLVLTAARSGEVRHATWDEIDTGGARVDRAGSARMKAKREHRVPLCGRALEDPRRGANARRRQPVSCSRCGAGGR